MAIANSLFIVNLQTADIPKEAKLGRGRSW
jgi:hypothetical protein